MEVPTAAFRSSGQDTDSGLCPAFSFTLSLIWLATSAFATVFGPLVPTEKEQPATSISAAAPNAYAPGRIDFVMSCLSPCLPSQRVTMTQQSRCVAPNCENRWSADRLGDRQHLGVRQCRQNLGRGQEFGPADAASDDDALLPHDVDVHQN